MSKERFQRIAAKIWDKNNCKECGGTGIVIGREKWKKNNGCATCFVRSTMTMISPDDLQWLLQKAGYGKTRAKKRAVQRLQP